MHLVAVVTGTEAAKEQRGQFRSLFVSKDYQGVIAHADALLAGKELQGEAREEVILYKLNASWRWASKTRLSRWRRR